MEGDWTAISSSHLSVSGPVHLENQVHFVLTYLLAFPIYAQSAWR